MHASRLVLCVSLLLFAAHVAGPSLCAHVQQLEFQLPPRVIDQRPVAPVRRFEEGFGDLFRMVSETLTVVRELPVALPQLVDQVEVKIKSLMWTLVEIHVLMIGTSLVFGFLLGRWARFRSEK